MAVQIWNVAGTTATSEPCPWATAGEVESGEVWTVSAPSQLKGQQAYDFIQQHLKLLVDHLGDRWEALYLDPVEGEYWELTYEGWRTETEVLTRVSSEYVAGKYGQLSETLPNS